MANRAAVTAAAITVASFGAVGDSVTDDTSAIQAAIDYAAAHQIQTVYLPAGKYRTTRPLYLDPPGNLRSNLADPQNFGFSLALVGDEGTGNYEACGSQIWPSASDFVALWVGPGQGMAVRNISVRPPYLTAWRNTLPQTGCGIAIAGGNGGASRTLIQGCFVTGYYRGIATGFNGHGAMCDSNTLLKCFVHSCFIGFDVTQSQNYINSVVDCSFGYCTIAIRNIRGPQVSVRGGNISCSDAAYKRFAISAVSALSTFTDNFSGSTFNNCRFTAKVTAPDAAINAGTYDCAAVNLSGFGVVPLRLESFSAGTATLSLWPAWLLANFGYNFNLATGTDLGAELAAATMLYACETITVFSGAKFHVQDLHIENPMALTRLLDGVGSNRLENLLFNYDVSHGDLAGAGNDAVAIFVCQQAFPFLLQSQGRLSVSDCNFSQVAGEGIVIDIGGTCAVQFDRIDRMAPPIVRYCYSTDNNIVGYSGNDPYSAIRGAIEFDFNPFIPPGFTGHEGLGAWLNLQERISGRRPRPMSAQLNSAQVAAYGVLGAVGTYPPLCGDTVYAVSDAAAATASMLLKSGAAFYSYGQALSGVSWSYKGKTSKITMDAATLKWMFAGLKIILNNGADVPVMVTGVHPALGYVDAVYLNSAELALPGDKATTFIGNVIKQDAYSLKVI